MTRCSELEPEILYRADGEGDPLLAPAVDGHLRVCPACRTFEAEARARIGALRSMPRRPVPAALDDRVARDVEGLVRAPEEARERWVSGWLRRLPRLPVPPELASRVFREPAARTPSVRLWRLGAAAASVAAVVLAGWFAVRAIDSGGRAPAVSVVVVDPSDLRIQTSLFLARSLGAGEAPAEDRR